jgi:small-conductance mechanosensitive channel
MDPTAVDFDINQIMTLDFFYAMLRALALLVAGFVLARLASAATQRVLHASANLQLIMLVRRGTYYLVLSLFVIAALGELGFSIGVLLGAAGILTVAIGFASQTSMSNLISGLFLIGEQPFAVGDVIKVGTTVGEVLSVDLLSIKLRTFDNIYVRIPNENIIKTEVSTLTRFPIRRIDVQLSVAYQEDLPEVRQVLLDVASRNPLCLEEPQPLFLFQGFGDSGLNIQFSVWVSQAEFFSVKTNIQLEIKAAFDEAGIEIPFPHRSLYTGSATEPFPVRIMPENLAGLQPDSPS